MTLKKPMTKIEEQKKEITGEPKNLLERQAISLVGRISMKACKGYTEKQWGRDCKDLPAFIIKRLPVRLTFDNNYFNALYQRHSHWICKLIEKMLEGIEVRLNVDYLKTRRTGQLAEKGNLHRSDRCLSIISWVLWVSLSVRFENEILDKPNFQVTKL